MTNQNDEKLEERLGYQFRDKQLLVTALTHSSAVPELRAAAETDGGEAAAIRDNERLEFLGDAVLDLLASEHLVATFPEWREGQLSPSRAPLVEAQTPQTPAGRVGDWGILPRGGGGEKKNGGAPTGEAWGGAGRAWCGTISVM